MARSQRVKSETGIYHVMSRGVNKQPIFEERDDYVKFIEVLLACKEIAQFEVFAYCLMSNHFHLLLRPSEEESLETIFRRIGGRYVVWFNRKYGRSGHLFQDRFASEPVDDEPYFLSCARYIVQNPVAAGICTSPIEYEFSSMRDYAASESVLTDTQMLLDIVGEGDVVEFLSQQPTSQHIDIDMFSRLTDNEAKLVMLKASGCGNASEFQRLDKEKRDKALAQMRKSGVSIRQASRITGIGSGVVRKCI